LVVARKKKGKAAGERGVRSGFIAAHCFREEREKKWSRAKPRTAGGAGVLSWQPLGSGGPTWNGEGRTAETARAVEEVARRRMGEGSGADLHSGSLRGSDGEVLYRRQRAHSRRRAAWRG
jgi:hypothetical protein